MVSFLRRTSSGTIAKLEQPGHLSPNIVIIFGALTVAVILGHLYTNVYNAVFRDCDKLLEAHTIPGIIVDIVHNTIIEKIRESTKTEPSFAAHFFPCINTPTNYHCHPEQELNGTRFHWFEIDKHMLHAVIVSTSCEYFAVVLVIHITICSITGGNVQNVLDQLWRWSSSIPEESLDAHSLSETRPDIVLLLGAAVGGVVEAFFRTLGTFIMADEIFAIETLLNALASTSRQA
ncbi:hypothetical protein DdX_15968 [Ditylenchus destructor]|uniref:Uncharacterized protein n=1 Tax=Ditylenchus destructor TaxID=166010 RepID=A0AAD4MPC3_9BILA|nr:hypothetical protein DdX_15968 [Ditylenchus destructor]